MKNPIQIKNVIPSIRNSDYRSPWRRGYFLVPIALALALLPLSQTARAVSPPPDGGYPGQNTAEGDNALLNLVIDQGIDNTAVGFEALLSLTSGSLDTAVGFSALTNDTADNNTATGAQALQNNTSGANNTANGESALFANSTGGNNTASGLSALVNNSTGSNNIALGVSAGSLLTTGNNNIDIGALGVAGESNVIRLGRTGVQKNAFIAGISGVTVAGGVGVIVGANGHLGTVVSSARFKDNIQPMDKASEAILSLRPVTFRYKKELDPDGIAQFGLVAEQVEKVNPDLVARDEQGRPYSVRYEAVNAMLLNEFLKEHRIVEEQKATITQLRSAQAQQEKEIKTLTAGLQKVNNQLELRKHAPRVVANNQ